ncbi:ARM repeat-containing protein [Rhodocollybia butyracea]|uniref:ARM repeat-containing protein n=1 Tax=Rhodocollybia butyracea TaxID=206335 RepID=A0A9P5UCE6_9AGAR|nr:ARM repeat-containing protein [Rhodocollybia butyracea]
MIDVGFLPSLPPNDIEHASHLILQAYGTQKTVTPIDELRRLQQELFDIQKLPEAWGLVIPLLNHQDENVQFFGAHTAQVKIARDWATFPQQHAESLRDMLIQLTSHSVSVGKSKFILRKLFVSLSSLALKLVPQHPTRWPDWILHCVTSLSGNGAPAEYVLDFLSIVAEEIGTADLVGPSKSRMQQTMKDATQMVVQAVQAAVERPINPTSSREVLAALKCFQAWLTNLATSEFSSLIPVFITLLNPEVDTVFVAASDTLQEIMSKSALSDGSGTRILTEPLLLWLHIAGAAIVESAVQSGFTDEVSYSLCKLLTALGDHSASYIAANIASSAIATLLPSSIPVSVPPAELNKTKGQLSQTFLRLLLAYTGFPGFYGADEDASEMTLGFWYMLQEALWNNDFYFPDGEEPDSGSEQTEMGDQSGVAKQLYVQLVQVLRRKITWPSPDHNWSKDQMEKFVVYRRDVGDILINAFYVIRDDMIIYFVNDITERLTSRSPEQLQGWEDIEATLHCISSIQEALDYEKTPRLEQLFSPQTLERLPTTENVRLRRTTLGLIGTYASWFAVPSVTVPPKSELLMATISYVVQSLPDQMLSLQAASALRNLCDANRKALAPQIGAFAELHAGLAQVPDSEKSKVMESLSSVIQALPPAEAIPTVEVVVGPIISRLFEVLQSQLLSPIEARSICILQLEALTGIAKGLTRISAFSDGLSDEGSDDEKEVQAIEAARQDPRMLRLRENILNAIRGCVEAFHDAEIAQELNDLVKSITSLPSDATLVTLSAPPLLEIVCFALQRQPTASWLTLAGILINQLSPPPPMPFRGKDAEKEEQKAQTLAKMEEEAKVVVSGALPVLLNTSLTVLGAPGGMENNPDIVQEFFLCLDRVAQNFTGNFYTLPPGALDTLMQCTIRALTLQERYSLVAACTFLSTFIHRSYVHASLTPYRERFIATYGGSIMRAILSGLAGQAPRSVTQNLIEMLSTMLTRCLEESRVWLKEVLFDPNFTPSKAKLEDKEQFMKTIIGSRSLKRTREAAQQFTLVARGLEGTSFGYTSVTM